MLSDEAIDNAKAAMATKLHKPLHQHNDCIRIAYQWLDAQKKTKTPTKSTYALKHIIENWGGRYVSQSDVEVAAYMHPEINGNYPWYNISSRLTEPSIDRLKNVSEAFTHGYRGDHRSTNYAFHE